MVSSDVRDELDDIGLQISAIKIHNKDQIKNANNIKDKLDDISLQLHTNEIAVAGLKKDELKNIRILIERVEKKQKDIYMFLFWMMMIIGVILTNSGMMGQLWDFNFSEFFKIQLL